MPEVPTSPPLRILLVEDNPDDEARVRAAVGQLPGPPALGHCATYDAGLAAIAECRHDVYLIDDRLGAHDGLELIRAARTSGCRAPVILLSGPAETERDLQALRAGASDHLDKQKLDPGILDRAIRSALERVRTERRLAEADRVASIGTLAAGAAHEINNPLATIVANLSFVVESLDPRGDPEIAQALADAQGAAKRVAKLVQDLRQLLKAAATASDPVDVNAVLAGVLDELRERIAGHATLRTSLPPLPLVRGEERRLRNTLVQLLGNAIEAIEPGAPSRNEITVDAEVRGDQVLLILRDTGRGIPLEVQRQLFTPFLTTKGVGEGTGLNLSLCRATLVSFGGELRIESEPGRGTTATVTLLTLAAAATTPDANAKAAPRRRVLVVDDDELVATSVRRALAMHDVLSVESVPQALELLESDRRFDVIFCDLMLPGQDGAAFYDGVLALSPDLAARIWFLTGGAMTDRTRALVARMPGRIVTKPFSIEALRKLVAAPADSGG